MINRNRRGISNVGVRTRLAIAAAVLVGGGAAGVVAVSAGHGGATAAQSAGFTTGNHHTIGEAAALSAALNGWSHSPTKSLSTLSKMTPMRAFSQVSHHGVTFAAQRGIVVLATKKFLVVKSANGSLHLWWLNGATRVKDVSSAVTGMAAMTGSQVATNAAMATGNMTPATTVMAGSTGTVTQLTSTVAKPTTITIATGTEVITITVASSTATVTQPTTTTTTALTTSVTQPVFTRTLGIQRGDLVFVAGTRKHGALRAQLVLFAAPLNAMPSATPTVTPSVTGTPTVTVTPTAVSTHS